MDRRELYLIITGIALLASVIIGVKLFQRGRELGELKQALAQNQTLLNIADSTIKADSTMRVIAQSQSDSTLVHRNKLRASIKIVHDTTYLVPDSTLDEPEVISTSSEVAHLLLADDSTINALKRVNQDQAKEIIDLYNERGILNNRVGILQKAKSPSNFSHGIQLGIGYCRTSTGGAPCVYAGYGFSLRL